MSSKLSASGDVRDWQNLLPLICSHDVFGDGLSYGLTYGLAYTHASILKELVVSLN